MSKIITVQYLNEIQFLQMPKAFMYNPKYEKMSNEAKLAYMLLRDLTSLSIKNKWHNEKNEVYVKFGRAKLAEKIHVAASNRKKLASIMKELTDYELIVEKRVGHNKCNQIFVCTPDDLEVAYNPQDLLDESEGVEIDGNSSTNYPQGNSVQGVDTQGCSKIGTSKLEGCSKNGTSGCIKIGTPGCSKSSTSIKTNIIKTKVINTNNKQQLQEKEKDVVVVKDHYGQLIELDIDSLKQEIMPAWESTHFTNVIPESVLNYLISLTGKYDLALLITLIERSAGASNVIKYMQGIIDNWSKQGIQVYDDYFEIYERDEI